MQKKNLLIVFFCFFLFFFQRTESKRSRQPVKVDEGFKERILNIIDSKGEFSEEEKAKVFDKLKVAESQKKRKIQEKSEELVAKGKKYVKKDDL